MKNYLIIGGSTGIGLALVQQLAVQGHRVYATYNKTEIVDPLPHVSYHHLDIMAEKLSFDFLPDTLDGLVYCPGSINLKPFHRIKAAAFVHDFQLQVVGAIQAIQAALPSMKAVEQASMVLFSTVAVQAGFNFHSQVATSKGAICLLYTSPSPRDS